MSEKPKTILLKGGFRLEEMPAAAAITPGMLLAMDGDGKAAVHASAKGVAERMFAFEDVLQGKTIADAYSTDNPVQCGIVNPGAEVYAWVKGGETVLVGGLLEADGAGRFQAVTNGVPLAVALEAFDGGDSAGDHTRIKVRVL